MKQRQVSVITTARVIRDINRAGQDAGITSIAKLLCVTRPRTKRYIDSAIRDGLVYAYSDLYRDRVARVCYSLTPYGGMSLEALDEGRRKRLL